MSNKRNKIIVTIKCKLKDLSLFANYRIETVLSREFPQLNIDFCGQSDFKAVIKSELDKNIT